MANEAITNTKRVIVKVNCGRVCVVCGVYGACISQLDQ